MIDIQDIHWFSSWFKTISDNFSMPLIFDTFCGQTEPRFFGQTPAAPAMSTL